MTRTRLMDKLAARFPQLVGKDAEVAAKTILETMAGALSRGNLS